MQWKNKVQFFGQVKTCGLNKSMPWKTGSVEFEYDAPSSSWKVKLFLKVSSDRVVHEIAIKRSVLLNLKCGRLIVEEKNGNGMHIKLTNHDIAKAKALISDLQKSAATNTTQNKAQVGLSVKPQLLSKNDSENMVPWHDEDDIVLFKDSYQHRPSQLTDESISSKASLKGTSSSPHPNNQRNRLDQRSYMCYETLDSDLTTGSEIDWEEEVATQKSKTYTGMKDFSKKAPQNANGLTASSPLSTKRFYSLDSSDMRPPQVKRLKSSSVFPANQKRNQPLYSVDSSLSSNTMVRKIRSPNTLDRDRARQEEKQRQQEQQQQESEQQQEQQQFVQPGFDNLGNTCYINSILQCVAHLEPLAYDFQSVTMEYKDQLSDTSMTRLFYEFMKCVHSRKWSQVALRDKLVKFQNESAQKFERFTEQDANEFLVFLFQNCDEEVSYLIQRNLPVDQGAMAATPATPIKVNFEFTYTTLKSYHDCKRKEMSTEFSDTIMIVHIQSDSTLQECIDRCFGRSEVDVTCQHCKKIEKATLIKKFTKRPRMIAVTLARYHYAADIKQRAKISNKIDTNSYVSIADYCTEETKPPLHIEPLFIAERENIEPAGLSEAGAPQNRHWVIEMNRNNMPGRGASYHPKKDWNDRYIYDNPPQIDIPDPEGCASSGLCSGGFKPSILEQLIQDSDEENWGQDIPPQAPGTPPLAQGTPPLDVAISLLGSPRFLLEATLVEPNNNLSDVDVPLLHGDMPVVIESSVLSNQGQGNPENEDDLLSESEEDDETTTSSESPPIDEPDVDCSACPQSSSKPAETRSQGSDEQQVGVKSTISHGPEEAKPNRDKQEPGSHVGENVKEAIRKKVTKSDTKQAEGLSKDSDLTLLANNLIRDLQEVQNLLEASYDASEIFDAASKVIAIVKQYMHKSCNRVSMPDLTPEEEKQALCHFLFLQAVFGTYKPRDSDTASNHLASENIRREILDVQYAMYDTLDKKLENFITDLSYLIVFQQMKVIKGPGNAPVSSIGNECKAQGSTAQKGATGFTVPLITVTQVDNEVSFKHVEVNMDLLDDVDIWDTAGLGAPMAAGAIPNIASNPVLAVDPELSRCWLLGKPLTQYTTEELQKVDAGALNEAEQLILAKALSTISYHQSSPSLSQEGYPMETEMEIDDETKNDTEDEVDSLTKYSTLSLMTGQSGLKRSPRQKNFKDLAGLLGDFPGEIKDCPAKTNSASVQTTADGGDKAVKHHWSELQATIPDMTGDAFPNTGVDCVRQVTKKEAVLVSQSHTQGLHCTSSENVVTLPLDDPSSDHVVPDSTTQPIVLEGSVVSLKPTSFSKQRDYDRLKSPQGSPRKKNKMSTSKSSSEPKLTSPDSKDEESVPLIFDSNHFYDSSMEANANDSMEGRDDAFLAPLSCESMLPRESARTAAISIPSCSTQHAPKLKESNKPETQEKLVSPRTSIDLSSNEKENKLDEATLKKRKEIEEGKMDFSYRLVGIVNHVGNSLDSGHYTSYNFNVRYQQWFYSSDKDSCPTTEANAKEESKHNGYAFFYMDKDLYEAYANRVQAMPAGMRAPAHRGARTEKRDISTKKDFKMDIQASSEETVNSTSAKATSTQEMQDFKAHETEIMAQEMADVAQEVEVTTQKLGVAAQTKVNIKHVELAALNIMAAMQQVQVVAQGVQAAAQEAADKVKATADEIEATADKVKATALEPYLEFTDR